MFTKMSLVLGGLLLSTMSYAVSMPTLECETLGRTNCKALTARCLGGESLKVNGVEVKDYPVMSSSNVKVVCEGDLEVIKKAIGITNKTDHSVLAKACVPFEEKCRASHCTGGYRVETVSVDQGFRYYDYKDPKAACEASIEK